MRKAKKTMIVLSIAFLLLGILSLLFDGYGNMTLRESFKPTESVYSYGEAVANSHINLNEISKMLPNASAMLGYEYVEEIISPRSISYYKRISDKTPAYVIEKGDVLHFKMTGLTSSDITYGGIESLPTAVPGWRLVRPFETQGEPHTGDLFYVKLTDLESVSKVWLRENPKGMISISSQLQGRFHPKQDYVNWITLRLDRVLYEKGVYLSPDLYKPLFSVLTVVAFALAILNIALFLFLHTFFPQK